jgi:hypothetical protein
MIEPEWLVHAGMLADTTLDQSAAQVAAQELGDEREVLPWLLVVRGGFAGWPLARAALKEVGKAVIRPRALAQEARSGAVQEQREACKHAVLRAIAVSHEGDRWAVDDMIRLRQRVSQRPQPNDFIATS